MMSMGMKYVLAGLLMVTGMGFVAGCGEVRAPWAKERVVVQTPVPADFAIVLEENQDTFYSRMHIRQVVTGSDLMSRTTWTTLRDANNAVASEFTTEHPLTEAQVQQMWNEVQRYKLMEGASTWYYWMTFPDSYRREEHTMQIKADGKVQSYKQLNHWGYKFQDLALQVEGVRFSVPPKGGVIVPATRGAENATEPATAAGTQTGRVELPVVTTQAATEAATLPLTQPAMPATKAADTQSAVEPK